LITFKRIAIAISGGKPSILAKYTSDF